MFLTCAEAYAVAYAVGRGAARVASGRPAKTARCSLCGAPPKSNANALRNFVHKGKRCKTVPKNMLHNHFGVTGFEPHSFVLESMLASFGVACGRLASVLLHPVVVFWCPVCCDQH